MSFSIRASLPIRGNLKGLSGNIVSVAVNENPSIISNGPTGPPGSVGPTGAGATGPTGSFNSLIPIFQGYTTNIGVAAIPGAAISINTTVKSYDITLTNSNKLFNIPTNGVYLLSYSFYSNQSGSLEIKAGSSTGALTTIPSTVCGGGSNNDFSKSITYLYDTRIHGNFLSLCVGSGNNPTQNISISNVQYSNFIYPSISIVLLTSAVYS